MLAIDADSHFMEPLDLFEKYIDPKFRARAFKAVTDPATKQPLLVVDNKPLKLLDVEEFLSAVCGYGQKESGRDLDSFDRELPYSADWLDMDKRVKFLDHEGFAAQVIYPTIGLLWEDTVVDPALADALCRAYNTWALELCARHKDRLYPAAHLSLRDPALAVRELKRVAKLGCHSIFVGAAPHNGKSFGDPAYDLIWAAAQDLDIAVGLHLVGHAHYPGSEYFRGRDPGFMWVTMNVIQDPRIALATMVYDGVFERFERLRVATIEAMAGWIGEWLERFEYRYKYMKQTSRMKRSPTEYFNRNIWISGDPEERLFPVMVQFAGDDKFFIGSDYPHAEGFVDPIRSTRERLSSLSPQSVDKILGANARKFYRIP
ncbi:MAG: amidohydrolase family protein [Candidatus Binataceae bacterium]